MITGKMIDKIQEKRKQAQKVAKYPTDLVIDISGPDGNVFYLIGLCRHLQKQLGLSEEEIKQFNADTDGVDYSTRLKVIQEWFGITYITPEDM